MRPMEAGVGRRVSSGSVRLRQTAGTFGRAMPPSQTEGQHAVGRDRQNLDMIIPRGK
jgi:hypothetical protein